MQNQTTVAVSKPRAVSTSKGFQLAAALLLGTIILFGVGFSGSSAMHNAAHDTRHAVAFPCH